MLRRTIMLASALALVAVAIPMAASANWTDNHVAIPGGTNPQVQFTGEAEFAGGIGNVHCDQGVEAALQLTGGQTDAHGTEFTVANPQVDCTVTELIGVICGEHSLQDVFLEEDATVEVNQAGKDLEITNIQLVNQFGDCLQITLENTNIGEPNEVPVTAQVDDGTNQTINEVELTGELYETVFEEPVAVQATLLGNPAGRYGFE